MDRHPLAIAGSLTLAVLASVASTPQPPRIVNAQVSTRPAGDLERTVATFVSAGPDARWIGYRVPAVDGDHRLCCSGAGHGIYVSGGTCCGTCRLERGRERSAQRGASGASGPIPLEGSDQLIVLLRAANRAVGRLAIFSADCELDAGGLPVVLLEGVRPEASLALLESFAAGDSPNRVADGAVMAIALHRGDDADAALERLSATGRSEALRRKVAFWLGQARGARGLSALTRILEEDASLRVREAAVFGISQSRAPGALDTLIAAARTHDEPRVRGRAIFWLGQKAGAKAAEAITERIAQDPDTEVKKRAVFALSQMPKDEGVPLLIEVARTNGNPAVRKQAMFWLAQSGDPRAVDFFAAILK